MNRNERVGLLGLTAALLAGCGGAAKVVKPEPTVVTVNQGGSADELFSQGLAAFDAGQWKEAQSKFSQSLEKNPRLVVTQYNLGVVSERLGDLSGAEVAYEAALKLDSRHLPSLLALGKVYRQTEKFEKGVALFEKALKESGWEYEISILNNLSAMYRLAKKFDLAEKTARKVLARSKDNADAYKNLAMIYFDQGNYRLAEFIIGNVRKLDDKDPAIYNNLGMIYLKFDDHQMALGQFQKAVSLDPNFVPGHMNLGALALSYRDYASAEKAFSKVVALDPNNYEGHLAYGFALDGQRSRTPLKGLEAAAEFEKVLALKANYGPAVCGAGWAYSGDKASYSKALSYLNQCKQLPNTNEQEQTQLDGKIKSLTAMLNAGAQTAPAAGSEREKPKPSSGASGSGLLDKVTEDAAKAESSNAEGTAAPASEETKK